LHGIVLKFLVDRIGIVSKAKTYSTFSVPYFLNYVLCVNATKIIIA